MGLGDLATAVPCLRGIARAYPDARRVLVAPRALEPLTRLLAEPWEVADHPGLEAPLPGRLRAPDVAVNLHGRGPRSHQLLLALEPRRLIAFGTEGVEGPCWRRQEHEVRRWCRLLEQSGIAVDPDDLDLTPPPEPPPAAAVGALLIHPGAASASRRWPRRRFAALARAAAARGWRVALTGGPGEVDLAAAVARGAGLRPDAVLAGRTSLTQLAAAVAAARCVVCGDTGVAHLATAFGTPSVVLFGPTPPDEWGPPPERLVHRVLWRGGRGDPHGAVPDMGLLEIEVDDVLAALPECAGLLAR